MRVDSMPDLERLRVSMMSHFHDGIPDNLIIESTKIIEQAQYSQSLITGKYEIIESCIFMGFKIIRDNKSKT